MTASSPDVPDASGISPDASLVYIDGELVEPASATVSVFDSGLNFADGVFEGIRVYDGAVFRLHEHVDRLFASARAFDLDIGMTREELISEILRWLRASGVRGDFHFRPIVTRGNRFPPRLDPANCKDNSRVIFVGGPIHPSPVTGVRVGISSVRRIAPDALDPRIKSLNYGNNLLGRLEAVRRGLGDAIMLDPAGFVAEASAANVFLLVRGSLLTPLPKACLEGITRQSVLDIARESGREVIERDITVTELINADEVFLTGTGAELTPVVEVEGRQIGSGDAGEITLELMDAYGRLVRSEGVPVDGD
jgi:branched-chain amino acid aminotransferase